MPINGVWKISPRATIRAAHPWLNDFERGMLISPDLDGLLSALFLEEIAGRVGKKCRLLGVYELGVRCDVYAAHKVTWGDARDAIWTDHDISVQTIRSIGQHLLIPKMVELTRADLPAQLRDSCNPNLWLTDVEGNVVSGLRNKYPFGTIHWLMWLFEEPLPKTNAQHILLSLPDSAGDNYFKFKPNATDWLRAFGATFPIVPPNFGSNRDDAEARRGPYANVLTSEFQLALGNKNTAQRLPAPYNPANLPGLNALASRLRAAFGWEHGELEFFKPLKILQTYPRIDRAPSAFRNTEFVNWISSTTPQSRVFSYAIHQSDGRGNERINSTEY